MRLGIRTKLIMPVLVAATVLILLVQLFILPDWKRQEFEQIDRNQRELIALLGSSLAGQLFSSDYASVLATLERSLEENQPIWREIELRDDSNTRIFPLDADLSTGLINEDFIYLLEEDLELNGYKLGTIKVVINWKTLWLKRLQNLTSLTLLFGGFVLVSIAGILLWQNSLVRQPISRLRDAVVDFAQGNLSTPLEANRKSDEIGELARACEHMRKNLSDAQARMQKTAEQALDEKARLSAIQESVASALVVVSSNATIQEFNRAATVIFGYQREEVIGKNVKMLLPPAIQVHHDDWFNGHLTGKNTADISHRRELYALHKNGHTFPIDISIRPMTISGSTQFTAIVSDISELKAVEKQLIAAKESAEEASIAKSEFLARMSHEIRTPMNGILGMARLLDQTDLDDAQHQKLSVILGSGDALMSIINDILDLAKIESKHMHLEQVDFDLSALLEEVLALYRGQAIEKGLALQLELNGHQHFWVQGDPLRIKQVLSNLLNNAIKFTDQGGVTLILNATEQGNEQHIRLQVADTGAGIDQDVKDSLFDPFQQADVSTTRKSGGTGLGLSICKQFAELMGGNVSIESELGKGSTFNFDLTLPNATSPVPEAVNVSDTTAEPDTGESTFMGRILVADDVAVNQMVVGSMLELLGLEVFLASNGMEAVEAWKNDKFDLVLMDCEMPEMDGYTAAATIRKQETEQTPDKRIPIIALTANAYADNKQRCLEAGMDDFLTKPIETEMLNRVLKTWLTQTVGEQGKA